MAIEMYEAQQNARIWSSLMLPVGLSFQYRYNFYLSLKVVSDCGDTYHIVKPLTICKEEHDLHEEVFSFWFVKCQGCI